MDGNPLAKESVLLWRIRCTAIGAAAFFLCGGAAVFNLYTAYACAAVFAIAYLAALLYYCPALYKNASWQIDGQAVRRTGGVFILRSSALPVARVQYAEVVQSPAQRFLHLGTVVFYTAGAHMKLDSLHLAQAQEIVEDINNNKNDNEEGAGLKP